MSNENEARPRVTLTAERHDTLLSAEEDLSVLRGDYDDLKTHSDRLIAMSMRMLKAYMRRREAALRLVAIHKKKDDDWAAKLESWIVARECAAEELLGQLSLVKTKLKAALEDAASERQKAFEYKCEAVKGKAMLLKEKARAELAIGAHTEQTGAYIQTIRQRNKTQDLLDAAMEQLDEARRMATAVRSEACFTNTFPFPWEKNAKAASK